MVPGAMPRAVARSDEPDAGAAVVDEDAAAGGEDYRLAFALAGGEARAGAGNILDFGTQEAGRGVHGVTIQNVW